MLRRRRSLRLSRGQTDPAPGNEKSAPSKSVGIRKGVRAFMPRFPTRRGASSRVTTKAAERGEGTEAPGNAGTTGKRKRGRSSVCMAEEEAGVASKEEVAGTLITANNINRPRTTRQEMKEPVQGDAKQKVGVKRSRRLSKPPVSQPVVKVTANPVREARNGVLFGSQKSEVTQQCCDREMTDSIVECDSPGNDENVPPLRPAGDQDAEPVALGEVWLTQSQERCIQHAGEVRRRESNTAAMCPPSSGGSQDSVGEGGATSRSCGYVGAAGPSSASEDKKGAAGLLQKQVPQGKEADTVDSVIDLCNDTNDGSSGGQSTGLSVESIDDGSARSDREAVVDVLNSRPPIDLEAFLPCGGLRRQEARLPRRLYVKSASGRGTRTKFTAATRQLVIDWAMLRQRRLRLGDDVLHLAVDLADALLASVGPDKFLDSASNQTPAVAKTCADGHAEFPATCLPSVWRPEPRKKSTYHLDTPVFPVKLCRLLMSCLFVAAKLIGRQATTPTAKDFVAEGGALYQGSGKKALLAAERSLAVLLKHDLYRPNAISFAGAFLYALNRSPTSATKYKEDERQLVTYLLDIAILSHSSLHMSASKMAAAAVWLACSPKLAKEKDGTATFEATTGFSVEELGPCLTHLSALFVDAQLQPHLYVHRKHSGVSDYILGKGTSE